MIKTMTSSNTTAKEQAERLVRTFGIRRPDGVKLRGSDSGIGFHSYEIRLVNNFIRCRKMYFDQGLQEDSKVQEYLTRQEVGIRILALGFDVEIDRHLNSGFSHVDFIPWPDEAEYYFSQGLADMITVTPMHELPYLLDFQYFNHVKAEKFNEVRFLQILKHEVRLYLMATPSELDEEKLTFLDAWIYRHVCNLDMHGLKEFHWFSDGFIWQEPNVVSKEEVSLSESEIPVNGITETDDERNRSMETQYIGMHHVRSSILKYSCTIEQLTAYFNVLKKENSSKGSVMLNAEAVDWMVGYYFKTDGRCTPANKPEFVLNMSKQEIMYFLYKFTVFISPRKKGCMSSPQPEVCKILIQCFPDMFRDNPRALSTQLKRAAMSWQSTATEIIDEAVQKHLVSTSRPNGRRGARV